MKNIDNKLESIIPVPIKVICVPFMIAGILITFGPSIVMGFVLFSAALGLFTLEERVTLDFKDKRYRKYVQFLWIKFGNWTSLGDFRILTITASTRMYRNNLPMGGAESFSTSTS